MSNEHTAEPRSLGGGMTATQRTWRALLAARERLDDAIDAAAGTLHDDLAEELTSTAEKFHAADDAYRVALAAYNTAARPWATNATAIVDAWVRHDPDAVACALAADEGDSDVAPSTPGDRLRSLVMHWHGEAAPDPDLVDSLLAWALDQIDWATLAAQITSEVES